VSTPAAVEVSRDLALNWGQTTVAYRLDRGRACVTCRRPAFMDNPDRKPQHKVCAERDLVRAHGPAGAWALAAAGYRKSTNSGDGDGGRPGAR